MSDFIKVCELAARAGGKLLVEMQGSITVREKKPKDLVTEADLASQRAIKAVIDKAYPDHAFLGEEDLFESGEMESRLTSEYCWVVDPLDGTTNYVHQLQSYCVSIALLHSGTPVVGVVYDPVLDSCYRAARGGGAWLNDRPIATSSCISLDQALIAASLSANVPRNSMEVARFIEILHQCRALRRLGSAALNLAYVASGCLDGYWATSVNTWDVAAGLLLVEEAGGCVEGIDGGEVDWANPRFVASASTPLQQDLTDALQKASMDEREG
jgi:myo-inositol-1(or 4)-monophosphatase